MHPANLGSVLYEDAGLVMVSPSTTLVDLPNKGPNVYNRVAFSDGDQGRLAAEYIYNTLGIQNVVVAINKFPGDTDAEIDYLKQVALEGGNIFEELLKTVQDVLQPGDSRATLDAALSFLRENKIDEATAKLQEVLDLEFNQFLGDGKAESG